MRELTTISTAIEQPKEDDDRISVDTSCKALRRPHLADIPLLWEDSSGAKPVEKSYSEGVCSKI